MFKALNVCKPIPAAGYLVTYELMEFRIYLLAFEVFGLQQQSRNNTFALAGVAEAFEAGLWLDMTSSERL